MTPEEKVLRGHEAQRILDNELVKEAFEKAEKDLFDAWAACAIKDAETQHELKLLLMSAKKFKAIFEGYIQTGKLAQDQLPKESNLKKLRRLVA